MKELPETAVTAREALLLDLLPQCFDHDLPLLPALLKIGSIRFNMRWKGAVAPINKLRHAQVFADCLTLDLQTGSNLPV